MKILIVYGTSEGQTRKIARFMENVLQEKNHLVIIADSTEEPPKPDDYDVIIIGSSIHVHKYHNSIKHYVRENADQLNRKHSAFFSVCLAAASAIPEEHEEANAIVKEFLKTTNWHPTETIQVAGALKYTQYDYFKRLVMRLIARKEGGDTDVSKDYEYTDWSAVKAFVLGFIKKIELQETG